MRPDHKPGHKVERIHLLGIAGSAMAPIAGMLKERGFHVTGSDVNVYPPASTLLDSLGIRWNEGFREENLKPAPDLCVIGNANSRGNPEVEYILDQKIPYCSMPSRKMSSIPADGSRAITCLASKAIGRA